MAKAKAGRTPEVDGSGVMEAVVAPKPIMVVLRALAFTGALYLMDRNFCGTKECPSCGPRIKAMVDALAALGVGKNEEDPIEIAYHDGETRITVRHPDVLSTDLHDLLKRLERDGYKIDHPSKKH